VDAEATAEATEEVTPEVDATATLPPSPTPSQEDRLQNFEDTVDRFRENIRLNSTSNAEIDAFFQRQALKQALTDEVVSLDDKAMFVNARQILVETEEEAQEILAALEGGESFAQLAESRSLDTFSSRSGGELGWVAVGFAFTEDGNTLYIPELEAALIEAPVGELLDPIKTDLGYHIIQVRAREERDIEGAERDRLREAQFDVWLENLREENEANISTNSNWPDFLPTS
jgi:parvulin-like peptidyl-prolyl isomerase